MKGSTLREILTRHGLRLRRELGQNFLVDEAAAQALVVASGVQPGDAVVEVGTGLGTLTRALVVAGAQVTTVEIDAGLVRALRDEALLPEGVELVHADALEVDLRALAEATGGATRRLVANLPYVSATPLLRRLLDLRDVFEDWSVMLQREVAERLVAQAGTREYGSLAVIHQLCARVTRERELKPGAFFPVPKVRSSFLRVAPLRVADAPTNEELARIERVLRPVFAQRRKTLGNGLRTAGYDPREPGSAGARALAACGIDPKRRAETLEPGVLRRLVAALDGEARPAAGAQPDGVGALPT